MDHYFQDEPGWRDTTLLSIVQRGLAELRELCRRHGSGVNWGTFVTLQYPVHIDWEKADVGQFQWDGLAERELSGFASDGDRLLWGWRELCAIRLMSELTHGVVTKQVGSRQECLFPKEVVDSVRAMPRRRARSLLRKLADPFCLGTTLIDDRRLKDGAPVPLSVVKRLERISSPQDLSFAVRVRDRTFCGNIALVIAPMNVDNEARQAYFPVTIGLGWGRVRPPRATAAAQHTFWRELIADLDQRIQLMSTWDPSFVRSAATWKPESKAGVRAARLLEAVANDRVTWRDIGHRQFEEMVAELYAGLGYHVRLTRPAKDGGRDVVADEHSPALARTIIECKHYAKRKVGVSEVRQLLGVFWNEKPNKAVLITTSSFSEDALAIARAEPMTLSLIDRRGFTTLARTYSDRVLLSKVVAHGLKVLVKPVIR